MTDTSKTRTQLIERALKSLGALEPGEAPSPEDSDTIDGLIDPLIAQLAADNVVTIQDPDSIDLDVFIPLSRLLANAAGPDFGSPINQEAKVIDEQILRRIGSNPATYQVMTGEYF